MHVEWASARLPAGRPFEARPERGGPAAWIRSPRANRAGRPAGRGIARARPPPAAAPATALRLSGVVCVSHIGRLAAGCRRRRRWSAAAEAPLRRLGPIQERSTGNGKSCTMPRFPSLALLLALWAHCNYLWCRQFLLDA